jgi:hypothetical protein
MIELDKVVDALSHHMPIKLGVLRLADGPAQALRTGLVIVDEVNGFATVGAGYLAPPVE